MQTDNVSPAVSNGAEGFTRTRHSSDAVGVAVAAAALVASVKVSIPFWPVPMTLQSFAVVSIALGFGARRGVPAVLAYLGLGIAGFPVFAGHLGGASYLLGPTGGYLLAMPLSVWAMARLHKLPIVPSFLWTTLCAVFGSALVLACGTLWLAFIFRGSSESASVGLARALALGCVPFLLGDLVKALLASSIVTIWPWGRVRT